jgi:DNA mismatch repair protein MutL
VPTFNKAYGNHQYFFVNNRYVKDKIFAMALKSAYAGLTPPGRYPVAVVFLEIPYNEVDVNAHPAKTEIRFRDAERVRSFIVSELKKALAFFGSGRATSELVNNFFSKKERIADFSSSPSFSTAAPIKKTAFSTMEVITSQTAFAIEKILPSSNSNEPAAPALVLLPRSEQESIYKPQDSAEKISLGNALFQLGNTYIIAENGDYLTVVDQHAAAERITLEKLKQNLTLDSQILLMPEICSLTKSQVELLQKNTDILLRFGIYFEKLAEDLVVVNSVPAMLGTCDAKLLMTDIADELSAFGEIGDIERKINTILSTISCHGSLRAGKKLTIPEMNCLLRQMEETVNIAQCCHGRPTYATITMEKLNKFFERS